MVTPRLYLAAGGLTLSLNDHLDLSPSGGYAPLEGLSGLGLPEADVRWFDGAGDGSSYRGARQRAREIALPLLVTASDRTALQARLSALATVLSPYNAPATLRLVEPDGTAWEVEVVRTGGGDWSAVLDTDGETWLRVDLTLAAGDPFWTRQTPASKVITPAGAGRGLLRGSLTRLRLASGQVLGEVTIENPGDAPAYPRVVVDGPATSLELTSSRGETLTWSGALGEGERLVFDHQAKTVVDGTGTNRYAELGPAPRFWAVPPGTHTATVALLGTSLEHSAVIFTWRPRRWLVL